MWADTFPHIHTHTFTQIYTKATAKTCKKGHLQVPSGFLGLADFLGCWGGGGGVWFVICGSLIILVPPLVHEGNPFERKSQAERNSLSNSNTNIYFRANWTFEIEWISVNALTPQEERVLTTLGVEQLKRLKDEKRLWKVRAKMFKEFGHLGLNI